MPPAAAGAPLAGAEASAISTGNGAAGSATIEMDDAAHDVMLRDVTRFREPPAGVPPQPSVNGITVRRFPWAPVGLSSSASTALDAVDRYPVDGVQDTDAAMTGEELA